ncbi:hypothetical protein [Paenibacillus lignilyticus]|uniref:Uncharacterized protein n=1 Tax=Paenibacillus lignilyticus TaxID=1172615 RepID=A0ABS5CL13_9BACL|nr:hypothetical protein [Paenibacillus lignilyticus]MBP3966549.1 hypothetical protein [Paenibacillus lignilyticus]
MEEPSQPPLVDDLLTDAEKKNIFNEAIATLAEQKQPSDLLPLQPKVEIEEPRHYHDVWNWECDMGAMIAAMQRVGLSREHIVKILKENKKASNELRPDQAALIYWQFTGGANGGSDSER